MPIHHFVDNISNSVTIHVQQRSQPPSKSFLPSFAFLKFYLGFQSQLTDLHSEEVFLTSSVSLASLLDYSNLPQGNLALASAALYIKQNFSTSTQVSALSASTNLAVRHSSPLNTYSSASASGALTGESQLFIKTQEDQQLTWFTSTNLLKLAKVEIVDTPDDNGGGQPTAGLKEFWA